MLEEMAFPFYLFPAENEKTTKNPFVFLTDKSTLKVIVSNVCKKLHHPVALIDYNALMKTAKPEKLESMVDMFPMRRACTFFREFAGSEYCSLCDCFHAKLMGIDKDSIEKNIKTNINHAPSFFYSEYKYNPPKVLEGFDRPVIEYHCPMLGYRELLFPLIYEKKILGVFFVGQILVYDRHDNNIKKKISTSFFNKNNPKELFGLTDNGLNIASNDAYRLYYEEIKKTIVSSDQYDLLRYDNILGFGHTEKEDKEYYSGNFHSFNDYLVFIGKVCSVIYEAEKRITQDYNDRRSVLISDALNRISGRFFDVFEQSHGHSFINKHELRTEELKGSWEALEVFANEILKKFKQIKEVIVFGDIRGINIEDSSKKAIVFSVPFENKNSKGSFDFSFSNNHGIRDYTNSLDAPAIFNGLSDDLPKENCILIQCHDIAMLILVNNLDEDTEFYIGLAKAIGKELVRINTVIALCSANLTKEKYLMTLRMYRHENAHISTRLMDNINHYFNNNGERFINTDEENRKRICNDMKNTVQLISNIANNIGFVTGSQIANSDPIQDVKPFNVINMLYEWKNMFRAELKIRNLEIIVRKQSSSHENNTMIIQPSTSTQQKGDFLSVPDEIMINTRLFELLTYNLVDNAVKYAYLGTNIYLIWNQMENGYELSITSYGPCMPMGEEMYGLYVRGKDTRYVQGDGIGLYVVRKIAEKLNLNVSHDCEKVSVYNAPLIPWFNKMSTDAVDTYSNIDAQKLIVNKDDQQILQAINENPSTKIKECDLTPQYLCKKIEMETWKTTFHIMIPMKENNT